MFNKNGKKAAEKAAKMGRPTKYSPDMLPKILSLMGDGASKVQVAAELGISRETLYAWCNPESEQYNQNFSDTIKNGETLSQAWWEKQGALGMWAGKQFNATAFIFMMKNKFEDYRDKPVGSAGNEAGLNDLTNAILNSEQ